MLNLLSKDTLRSQIERASNGLNTIIYDTNGYPNVMYVLEPPAGGHPAFTTVDGNVNRVFISKYPTCDCNSVPVGLSAATPVFNSFDDDIFRQDSTGLSAFRTSVQTAKGTGWHYTNVLEWNAYLKKSLEMNPFRAEYYDLNNLTASNRTIVAGDSSSKYFIISTNIPYETVPAVDTVMRLREDGATQPIRLVYKGVLEDSTAEELAAGEVRATYVFQYSSLNLNALEEYIAELGDDAFKALYLDGGIYAYMITTGEISDKKTGFVSYRTGSKNNVVDTSFGLNDIYYEQFYPGYLEWLDGAYLLKDNEDANPYMFKIGNILYNYVDVADFDIAHTTGYSGDFRVAVNESGGDWLLGLTTDFDSTNYRIGYSSWHTLNWVDSAPEVSAVENTLSAIFHINIATNETLMAKINNVTTRTELELNNTHSIINDFDTAGPPIGSYHYPMRQNRFNYYWIKSKDAEGTYGGTGYNDPRDRFLGFTTRLSYLE